MTVSGERDLSRIGALDYALMTVGSCLAAYSGGMSIMQPAISSFAVIAILIGAAASYGIRIALLRSPWIKVDGFLYAIAALTAFGFGVPLQDLLPQGGFPREVIAAGWLTWMLILGSLFTWQDSTLLFQAVPSIAMFGLVGCYDTFRGVTFAFFGFLLCLTTLFARAHRRQMLRQAADSGFFTRGLAPGTPTPSVETTPGLARKMEAGPWKWIAGPEWALGSALTVVVLSLLGAPVVRDSVSGVSGFVKIAAPKLAPRPTTSTSGMPTDPDGSLRIGRGPNKLTQEPVFETTLDRARYLRQMSLDTYTGRGWRATIGTPTNGLAPNVDINALSLEGMRQPWQLVSFQYLARKPIRTLPVPGVATTVSVGMTLALPDGRLEIRIPTERRPIEGQAAVTPDGTPIEANRNLPLGTEAYLADVQIPDRVRQLAIEASGSNGTDYEKARRIRDAIASRIVYNIDAAATPGGADPVDYALFESKQGYCDVYASAMTVMARVIGIPSRYVVGYLPGEEERDAAGRYVVLESDLHAWAELYFKDYGWVVFDATEGAAAVPGNGRRSPNDLGPWLDKPWVRATLNGGMILAGVVLLGYFAWRVLRQKRDRSPQGELADLFLSFSGLLERSVRVRRDPSRTPDEFMRETLPKLGTAGPMAHEINTRFVSLLYSREGATPEALAKLKADLRNLRRMLRDERRNRPR